MYIGVRVGIPGGVTGEKGAGGVVPPLTPIITLTSAPENATPQFMVAGTFQSDDVVQFETQQSGGDWSSSTTIQHIVTQTEVAASYLELVLSTLTNGNYNARAKIIRGELVSQYSNVLSFTIFVPVILNPMGMNIDSITYYSAEQALLDRFKSTGPWITSSSGTWDTGEEALLPLDANGWVTSFPAVAHTFTTILKPINFIGASYYYPPGKYVVLYDGEGTITYSLDAIKDDVASAPGRDVLNVANPQNGFVLQITAIDPNMTGNYLRNIRIVHIDHEADLATGKIFHPKFVDNLRPFSGGIRYMDWWRTNNSNLVNWTDRVTLTTNNWGGVAGVPVEVMVALSNELGVDCWMCMPHQATDDFVTQCANLVHSLLDPGLKVYVEYSNETWNSGMFTQAAYCQAQGLALWPTANPYQANRNWYGLRASQVMDLWKAAWGADSNRIVRVFAGQSASPSNNENALLGPLTGQGPFTSHFDAFAIAPYFGYDVPTSFLSDPDGGLTRLFQEMMTGGAMTGGAPEGMITQSLVQVAQNNILAKKYNLELICYEGGQTLESSSNDALTPLYTAANRDQRMGTAYDVYLKGIRDNGVSLFFNFASAGSYGKYGSWGALESTLQDPATSPKYQSLLRYIQTPYIPSPPESVYQGLGDLPGNPPALIHFSMRMAWTASYGMVGGKGFDLATASNTNRKTFTFLSTGFIDRAALATWFATNGPDGYMLSMYDHVSGGTLHTGSGTPPNVPIVRLDANGWPYVVSDSSVQAGQLVSGTLTASAPWSISMVARRTANPTTAMGVTGTNTGSNGVWVGFGGQADSLSVTAYGSTPGGSLLMPNNADNDWHMFSAVVGTDTFLSSDGVDTASPGPSIVRAYNAEYQILGRGNPNSVYSNEWTEITLWGGALVRGSGPGSGQAITANRQAIYASAPLLA